MPTLVPAPTQREARFSLECLAQDDAELVAQQVGADRVDGVRQAQACLRAALSRRITAQEALDVTRLRLTALLPAGDPLRRSAVLTLMLARGIVRGAVPLPFDGAACDLVASPRDARPGRPAPSRSRPQS